MEFRGELEKESLSYKRQHMLRRFSKAAKLAAELADLASKRCNDRTVLEAEAYSLWMQGTLFFEKEQWEPALAKLSRTRCAAFLELPTGSCVFRHSVGCI